MNGNNVTILGYNAAVDVLPLRVLAASGAYVFPTAARVHAIVSSSANDASAGTGARTVRVVGVDSAFKPLAEVVTLNGTTPVNTVGSYLWCRLEVLSVGNVGANVGTITATAATDATVTATIPLPAVGAAVNMSADGVIVTPFNKGLWIDDIVLSTTLTTATVTLRWQVQCSAGSQAPFATAYMGSTTVQSGAVFAHRPAGLWVPPSCYVRFAAASSTASHPVLLTAGGVYGG